MCMSPLLQLLFTCLPSSYNVPRQSKINSQTNLLTGELFIKAPYDIFDPRDLKHNWMKRVSVIFEEAQITVPGETYFQTGGKTGLHSEHLGFILAEMQFLQRAYPNAAW